MWQRMQPVVEGSIVVSLDEVKRAMRLMAEKARVIAEGAGALGLAAALTRKAGGGAVGPVVFRGQIQPPEVFPVVFPGRWPEPPRRPWSASARSPPPTFNITSGPA